MFIFNDAYFEIIAFTVNILYDKDITFQEN